MSHQARLGLLVFASTVAFVAILFAVTNRSALLADSFTIEAGFDEVGGLRAGMPVLYRGIDIGNVDDVALPTRPGGPIIVTLNIREDTRHLVRTDTRAQIKTEGVVGDLIVVLSGGSADAPVVEEGDRIQGVDPLDLFDAANDAMATMARFDSVAAALQGVLHEVRFGDGAITRALNDPEAYDRMLRLAAQAEQTLVRLEGEAVELADLGETTAARLQDVLAKVDSGDGTVARLLNDPEAYETMLRTARTFEALGERADTLLTEAELAAHWGTVALYRAAQNMEAVQSHWLLRGFFRDRGDASSTPFEIREDALATTDELLDARARALQQWERELRALEARLLEAGAVAPEPADSTRPADPTPRCLPPPPTGATPSPTPSPGCPAPTGRASPASSVTGAWRSRSTPRAERIRRRPIPATRSTSSSPAPERS